MRYHILWWSSALLLVAGLGYCSHTRSVEPTAQTPIRIITAPAIGEDFVSNILRVCNVQLSPLRQTVLTSQLRQVTDRYFPTSDVEKQSYVYLICIESKFNNSLRSRAGAVGYTQLMPKYAQAFADRCQLGKLGPTDIADPVVNLMLGACQFSYLLGQFGGNVALALAGYNSGENSPTTRKLSQLGEGLPETSGYLAKYLVITEKMRLVSK